MANRRGNNEGSIYHRKVGYWVGQYGVQTAEGAKTRYIYANRPLAGARACLSVNSWHSPVGWQPQPRFHDLRHTCTTLLLKQGVNPKFVQERLGHADISLTLNVYSHVLPDIQHVSQ